MKRTRPPLCYLTWISGENFLYNIVERAGMIVCVAVVAGERFVGPVLGGIKYW